MKERRSPLVKHDKIQRTACIPAIERALEEARKADFVVIGILGDEKDREHDIGLGYQIGDENYEWRKA